MGKTLLLQSSGEERERKLIDRFFKSERRGWLIVRLKAIECYEGLLCYLSSFINLLRSDL